VGPRREVDLFSLSDVSGPADNVLKLVEATETAISRVQPNCREISGAVFAANCFFPFTNGPNRLCAAGVATGLVPAGGQNEDKVREYFGLHGVTIGYLPELYRGFPRY